ncbi:MAG: threonine--tRNA ligase [Clostridiales bacterium]|jgi:threonyl-tRNA synthetase|nr:threonine--tRNA ligase [Clostridiales bacterium]
MKNSERNEDMKRFWHTASHIMAQAVLRLYPHALFAIGPATDSGFYYDFDLGVNGETFTADDLRKIEKEMKKIVQENLPIERFELPRDEALSLMKNQPYKVELINDLPLDEVISFYKQGDFTDLCAGPHLESTGSIKAVKLLSITGAYWRGNEKNKMLQRIYGVAFETREQLDRHMEALEQAKLRDHNKLGRELGIFTTSELVGQGLPLIMPRGAKILQIMQRFVEDEEEKRGYVLTKTPYMAKSDLYKISGHWQHYKDGMFVIGDEDSDEEVLALRPMTCPFQYQIYNANLHSYKDLPIRYNETSTLFRNEASGEMHGLIRIRQFTLAEGHIICTPEQLEDEVLEVIDLINFIMNKLDIANDITYRLSKWDPENKEKYVGTEEGWEKSQDILRRIIDKAGIEYVEADGEAAFYGPKLDLQLKNVHGKEDTIITVQVDLALAERFGMTYVDSDNQKKSPYIIHRSSLGCYERTLAMLIEKHAGAFPFWLAPVQAQILPIADRHQEYVNGIAAKLKNEGLRVEIDARNEKIGYKIREAQKMKVPFMLIVGDSEIENGTVAVRERSEGDLGAMKMEEVLKLFANS